MKWLFSFLIYCFANIDVSAAGLPDFPFVPVSGTASREVAPDEATIRFEVFHYADKSEDAVRIVQQTLKKLTDELIALGVSKKDFTADDLEKSLVRQRGEQYQALKVLGYDISRSVRLELKNIGKFSEVIQKVMIADYVKSVRSHFGLSTEGELENELILEACEKAKSKGELLAKGVGGTLGDVYAVSSSDFEILPVHFGLGRPVSFGENIESSAIVSGSAEGRSVPVFAPKTIEFRASVEILYRFLK